MADFCSAGLEVDGFAEIFRASGGAAAMPAFKLRIFGHPLVFLRVGCVKTLRYEVTKMFLMQRASTTFIVFWTFV